MLRSTMTNWVSLSRWVPPRGMTTAEAVPNLLISPPRIGAQPEFIKGGQAMVWI